MNNEQRRARAIIILSTVLAIVALLTPVALRLFLAPIGFGDWQVIRLLASWVMMGLFCVGVWQAMWRGYPGARWLLAVPLILVAIAVIIAISDHLLNGFDLGLPLPFWAACVWLGSGILGVIAGVLLIIPQVRPFLEHQRKRWYEPHMQEELAQYGLNESNQADSAPKDGQNPKKDIIDSRSRTNG